MKFANLIKTHISYINFGSDQDFTTLIANYIYIYFKPKQYSFGI